MIEVELEGEQMHLSADKALIWPAARTLLIADPHFGKGAAFRAAGIPVPEGATGADLARLTKLLDMSAARRLIVLGDFFHAREGRCPGTLGAIESWRAAHPGLDIMLVMGNHDRHAGRPPEEWGFQCVDEHREGPFVFRHEPTEDAGGYVLAGHVHPAIRLDDIGGSEKAACFWFGERVGVLPAFGRFTGTHAVRSTRGDRVYAVGPGAVIGV